MAFLAPPRLRNSAKIAGAAVAALFLLSACGGDDGEARDPIDKYIGTWKNDECISSSVMTVGTEKKNAYSNESMVVTKINQTEASFKWIYRFYLPTDKECAKGVIYTITKTGENIDEEGEYGATEGVVRMGVNRLVYKDSQMIDGGMADLLEDKEAPLSKKTDPIPVGSAVPQKTLLPEMDYNGDSKTIAKIDGYKLTMKFGHDRYPTTFDEESQTFTKQPPQ